MTSFFIHKTLVRHFFPSFRIFRFPWIWTWLNCYEIQKQLKIWMKNWFFPVKSQHKKYSSIIFRRYSGFSVILPNQNKFFGKSLKKIFKNNIECDDIEPKASVVDNVDYWNVIETGLFINCRCEIPSISRSSLLKCSFDTSVQLNRIIW